MNNDTQKLNTTLTESPTAMKLFERIDAESITPTSRLKFVLEEWTIWFMWVATTLFGALALAISGYVTLSAPYALYEATHENFLTFFVSVMPYIWVLLFAVMVYVSVYEIRKTKRGYKYNTFLVLGSNLACTVLGAMLLHSLGLGYILDKKLGEQIGFYMSIDKMEQHLWQMPDEGRVIGVLIPRSSDDTNPELILNFKDINGMLWRLDITEVNEREKMLLARELPVRLLGVTTSDFSFHVCGVFAGMPGRPLPRREMSERREEFDSLLHEKVKKFENWAQTVGEGEASTPDTDSICSRLPVMQRLR